MDFRSLQTNVANTAGLTDNGAVSSALSEQEVQRLAEYFSILREWSLRRNGLKDRDDDTPRSPDASLASIHQGHLDDRRTLK
jgi:hypothetical protein